MPPWPIRLHRAIATLMIAALVLTAMPSGYAIGPAHNASHANGAIPVPIKVESSLIIICSAQWGNDSPHFLSLYARWGSPQSLMSRACGMTAA